jgi:hypothetical protein
MKMQCGKTVLLSCRSDLVFCLPTSCHFLQSLIPPVMLAADIYKCGAPCQPVSPGRGQQMSSSCVPQLSPHVARYVLAKFCFYQ